MEGISVRATAMYLLNFIAAGVLTYVVFIVIVWVGLVQPSYQWMLYMYCSCVLNMVFYGLSFVLSGYLSESRAIIYWATYVIAAFFVLISGEMSAIITFAPIVILLLGNLIRVKTIHAA